MDRIVEVLIDVLDWNLIAASSARVFLILFIFWLVRRIIGLVLLRMKLRLIERNKQEGDVPTEARKRADTLVRLLEQGVSLILWLMLALIILREIGVEIAPILASAGVAGLAIGFGAQNLVRDVISGFFIILENQVRVGDVAIINGTGGVTEAINFRTIVLRDLSGTVHIFPNGTITTLSNMTRDWSAYLLDIGVAYKEDPDHVMQVMRDVAREMRKDSRYGAYITTDLEVFGVDQFADSAVVIRARLVTLPIKQWEVGREYRRRLKKAFDQHGIEIPFPHRSLYVGEATKPVAVQLLKKSRTQHPEKYSSSLSGNESEACGSKSPDEKK